MALFARFRKNAEIELTADLVRDLLRDQHPDLADRPVELGARGWANQLWRLGDDLAVRLPWKADSADPLLQENTWVPTGAPEGRGRGGALTQVRGVARQFGALADLCKAVAESDQEPIPDPAQVRAIWDDAMAAPGWGEPPLWLHGDLHPANVLTRHGELCGVVDFGDLCAGDPALDLAACWILLPDHAAIERFRAAYPRATDDATWRRARGWAIWRAFGSLGLGIAAAGPPGGKPSWGPPALASLHRLTTSIT